MTKQEILKKLINGTANGYNDNLLIVGSAGIGKTESIFQTLKELNLQENEHYIYLANQITARGFLDILQDVNKLKNPKLLILDDIENSLKNTGVQGILKGAMWKAGGKKRIIWHTNNDKINFEFLGKIIIVLNYINLKNPVIQAITDRAEFYEINPSPQEIAQSMLEIAKQPYLDIPEHQRLEIANFIIDNGIKSTKFSFRLLFRAFGRFKNSPNHWRELTKELL